MIDTMYISLPVTKSLFYDLADSMEQFLESENTRLFTKTSDKYQIRYTTKFAQDGFLEIAFHREHSEYPKYFFKIRLQPIRLIFKHEYIKLATSSDFHYVEIFFNNHMDLWFPDFEDFLHLDNWKLNRIDYAVNYYTKNIDLLMKILHKGKIPNGFQYRDFNDSLYLTSDAVNINFYDKFAQLKNKPYVDFSVLPKAENILRFEVQCKSDEIYRLKKDLQLDDLSISTFWNPQIAARVILNRIFSIIGSQDFVPIDIAKSKIQENHKKISPILFEILDNIQQFDNLNSAKKNFLEHFPDYSSNKYEKYLVKIRKCDINPITIPKKFSDFNAILPNPFHSIVSLIH